jgi:hypothetical protein
MSNTQEHTLYIAISDAEYFYQSLQVFFFLNIEVTKVSIEYIKQGVIMVCIKNCSSSAIYNLGNFTGFRKSSNNSFLK